MEPAIQLAPGADQNGFAEMLATMLRQSIDDRPDKKPTFNRMWGRVALIVEDLTMAVTLDFRRGRLVIYDGVRGLPDVTVRTSSEWHTKMSLVEIGRFGLPDRNGEVAREVAEAEKRGEIKIRGALLNLPLMMRLTRVMSIV